MANNFVTVSKKNWLDKIAKDLKIEDTSSLKFKFEDFESSPFSNLEDISKFDTIALRVERNSNSWELIEEFDISSDRISNSLIKQSLENGANGLLFRLKSDQASLDIESILEGVNAEFISSHLEGDPDLINSILNFYEEQGADLKKIKGSITFFDDTIWKKTSSDFKYQFQSQKTKSISELADLLLLAFNQLKSFQNPEITLQQFANRFQFQLCLSDHFLFNIAKIRALRLLWKHLTDSFYLEYQPIKILCKSNLNHATDRLEHQYIFASLHILSASAGSADGILLHIPHDEGTDIDFRRRITRNLHHLTAMESKIETVIDPLAGSYHIEKMSNEIAAKVWNSFQIKIQDK